MPPAPNDEPNRPTAHGPLSHLLGRFDFLGDIGQLIDAAPPGRHIAVLLIDAATPNQYEEMVQTLGQAAADLFEDASAQSIGECLPAQATLYGLSATRFGSILHADGLGSFTEVLDRIAYGVRSSEREPSFPVATSVGIGIAYYPDHGASPGELFQAAISGARESLRGGHPWCAYSPEFDRTSRRAALLLRDILPALAGEDQLRLVYQPKTDLATGQRIGAEALVRWNHPTLGPIPPDEFVPLIERTTLVNAMTDWILSAALRQTALWRASGIDPQISINVSMQDVWDPRFTARLTGLLERHAVQPDWINIEVTESALMKDPVRIGRQLEEVRRLGVAVEIDDYGTGQSGLSYLKYIPASYVKIAQVFVSRLASDRVDQSIVRSTIDLAHELGLKVVAEGIRDQLALDWLRAHGCDIGQGNFLSPALEAFHFEQSLGAPQ
jgi:EAL domain-containing protein (putative c-di-GMP-specific phosphodiesterase class I)/GGDEF domain-containing protein